jgi:hypothetical protein
MLGKLAKNAIGPKLIYDDKQDVFGAAHFANPF